METNQNYSLEAKSSDSDPFANDGVNLEDISNRITVLRKDLYQRFAGINFSEPELSINPDDFKQNGVTSLELKYELPTTNNNESDIISFSFSDNQRTNSEEFSLSEYISSNSNANFSVSSKDNEFVYSYNHSSDTQNGVLHKYNEIFVDFLQFNVSTFVPINEEAEIVSIIEIINNNSDGTFGITGYIDNESDGNVDLIYGGTIDESGAQKYDFFIQNNDDKVGFEEMWLAHYDNTGNLSYKYYKFTPEMTSMTTLINHWDVYETYEDQLLFIRAIEDTSLPSNEIKPVPLGTGIQANTEIDSIDMLVNLSENPSINVA